MALYYGEEIMKVKQFLNCKRIISGVSNRTSCRQIFKEYNILTLPSLYMLEVICFIKKYKDSMVTNKDIHDQEEN
jgi:hypothetical protein